MHWMTQLSWAKLSSEDRDPVAAVVSGQDWGVVFHHLRRPFYGHFSRLAQLKQRPIELNWERAIPFSVREAIRFSRSDVNLTQAFLLSRQDWRLWLNILLVAVAENISPLKWPVVHFVSPRCSWNAELFGVRVWKSSLTLLTSINNLQSHFSFLSFKFFAWCVCALLPEKGFFDQNVLWELVWAEFQLGSETI
jgi:hypothetical protein